jgi:hypothetical protein
MHHPRTHRAEGRPGHDTPLLYATPAKATRPTTSGYSADDWTTACKQAGGQLDGSREVRAKKRVWT